MAKELTMLAQERIIFAGKKLSVTKQIVHCLKDQSKEENPYEQGLTIGGLIRKAAIKQRWKPMMSRETVKRHIDALMRAGILFRYAHKKDLYYKLQWPERAIEWIDENTRRQDIHKNTNLPFYYYPY